MNHTVSDRDRADVFAPASLGDLIGGTLHRWRSVVVVAAVALPVAVLIVLLIPAQFDSYAQLLIRLGRGSVALDPTTSLTPTVSLQDSRQSQVTSVREMLGSRAIAEEAVRRVGDDRVLRPYGRLDRWIESAMGVLPSGPPDPMGDLTGDQVAAQIRHEQAVAKAQKMLNQYSAKDAYTINLEVRSGDPFLSRDLLVAMIDSYRIHHAEAHRTDGSHEFFSAQAEAALARVNAAKEAMRRVKDERGIIEIGSSQSALRGLIDQVESELVSNDNAMASATSELQSLEEQMAQAPQTIRSEVVTGITRAAGDSMRQSLYELEVRYNELASKLNDSHPKLIALKEQLRNAERIATAEQGELPQTKTAANPVYQELLLSRLRTTASLAGLAARRETLLGQKADLAAKLSLINEDEIELTRLGWEVQLAESEYMRAAENRDQARMIDELSKGAVSEVAVVQPATLILKKVKPRRSVLLVLAVACVFALAVGQAVMRQLLFPVNQAAASRKSARTNIAEQPLAEPAEDEFNPRDELATRGHERPLAGLPR